MTTAARATLLDYNGVLVDDERVHLAAFRDALAPLGVDLGEREYFERYVGFDDVGAFRAVLRDAGRTPTDTEVRALVRAKMPRYMERAAQELRVFPGAAELVRRRAAVAPVAVVSGALAHEVRFGLERMGVLDRIAFVVAAEDTREGKPDPEGYLAAKGRVGVPAVVIEDSAAGIAAALAAGLRCVAVAHTHSEEELARWGAHAVARDLAAIDDDMLEGDS
jgi:HAD superfamily hydrolase (TIGR01509 family)